jgi:hypothetical protein
MLPSILATKAVVHPMETKWFSIPELVCLSCIIKPRRQSPDLGVRTWSDHVHPLFADRPREVGSEREMCSSHYVSLLYCITSSFIGAVLVLLFSARVRTHYRILLIRLATPGSVLRRRRLNPRPRPRRTAPILRLPTTGNSRSPPPHLLL